MTHISCLKIVLTLLLLSLISNLFSKSNLDYANYLLETKDYYRAISAYKEVSFFSDNDKIKKECQLKVATSYCRSKKFKSAIRTLAHFESTFTINDSLQSELSLRYGNIYYQMRLLPMALANWTDMKLNYHPNKPYYLLLYYSETEQYDRCEHLLKTVDASELTTNFDLAIQKLKNRKKKSRFLALTFSTLIPGAGQTYCNHYYDGMLAFLYVSSSAYLSYLAYLYEEDNGKSFYRTTIAISFTSVLYFANLLGADKTCRYRNKKMKEDHLKPIRNLLQF